MSEIQQYIDVLNGLDFKGMYGSDFLHTWDKTTDELKALYATAAALRNLRERNISSKIFDSGLAVSLFRDNSTRTRFSFSKASNLLGLELQDLDEKKSQIAHGETVRETATMISFMADVIGIRDDMYIGKGDAYMAEVSESVQQAYNDGVLDRRGLRDRGLLPDVDQQGVRSPRQGPRGRPQGPLRRRAHRLREVHGQARRPPAVRQVDLLH